MKSTEFVPAPPPKLGVGFSLMFGWEARYAELSPLIDFYELSPDVLCQETVCVAGARRLDFHPQALAETLARVDRPLVVHGLNLSIGSAAGWNPHYVRILDQLCMRLPFPWHSEHLGFLVSEDPEGRPLHAGVMLPLPLTDETVALVAARADAMTARYGVPFLLENLTHFLPGLPTDRGRDEVAFLNDLVEASRAWLLLDLYNLYCNAVNFGFDPFAALARLRLDRVAEIHVAGGVKERGLQLDVHSRVVPAPVWDLLDWVVERTPHLGGILYELMPQAMPVTGPRIEGELERARAAWQRHRRAFAAGRAEPSREVAGVAV